MAKDPKNFTGENVAALLAEYDRHQRAREDWKGFSGSVLFILSMIGIAVCIGVYFISMVL